MAPYDKKLHETKIKMFCSKSCSAKYNNKGKIHNPTGKGLSIEDVKILTFSDEEIINFYNNSTSIKDFGNKLGYRRLTSSNNLAVLNKLKELNLDLKKLQPVTLMEEASILTKKELYDRSKNWQRARSAISKNARNVFENSGQEYKCAVCGYDKHIEVAHIKAVSDFDNDALICEINNINNLIPLCPNHHWEFDNHILQLF